MISDFLPHKLNDEQIKEVQQKVIKGFELPTPMGVTFSLSLGLLSASLNSGLWVLWFPKEWLMPVEKPRNPKWERKHDLWVDSERNLYSNGGVKDGTVV